MDTQQSVALTNDKQGVVTWPTRALVVVGAALGLGAAFDVLFYGKLPGVSFPLYIAGMLGVLLGLARWWRVQLPKVALILMAPLLFFTAMVAVRANGFVTFLNISLSLYLLLLIAHVTFRPQLRSYGIAQYLAVPLYAIAHLGERWSDVWQEMAVVRHLTKRHPAVPQVVRGVFIAVPILFLFGALFASADLVFRQYMANLFQLELDGTLIVRLVLIVVVASVVLVWLAQMLQFGAARQATDAAVTKKGTTQAGGSRWLGSIELMIIFGSLNVLFLSFLAVQLTYLFGGEQNILHQGFTYAEYARKGFFELIAVAVISAMVLLIAEKQLAGATGKQRQYFKILAGLLIGQVLVVMVSAFQRLGLYESAYGFTSLRLYSHLFIVWLAVVLLLLAYKIVRDKPEQLLAFGVFVSVVAAVAVVNVVNVDAFVARKNVDRYYATGKIDMFYLSSLSEDAVPQVARLLDAPSKHVRGIVSEELDTELRRMQRADGHWQSANLSRKAAIHELMKRQHQLGQLLYDERNYHNPSYIVD